MSNTVKQNTPQWTEMRKSHIGASEVAAICGKNPYKSAYDVWLEKTGRKEPDAMTPAMIKGVILEENARRVLSDDKREYFMPKVYLKDEYLMASVDAVNFNGTEIYEIKCPGQKNFDLWKTSGVIPEMYKYQIIAQMYVSGLRSASCAVYEEYPNGYELFTVRVLYDKTIAEEIAVKCKEFWRWVKADKFPEELITAKEYVQDESSEFGVKEIEYEKLVSEIKELEIKRNEIKDWFLERANGRQIRGEIVSVAYSERKGAYDMDLICKTYDLDKDKIELMRTPTTTVSTIRIDKAKKKNHGSD